VMNQLFFSFSLQLLRLVSLHKSICGFTINIVLYIVFTRPLHGPLIGLYVSLSLSLSLTEAEAELCFSNAFIMPT
jgi:hypothetical protein